MAEEEEEEEKLEGMVMGRRVWRLESGIDRLG